MFNCNEDEQHSKIMKIEKNKKNMVKLKSEMILHNKAIEGAKLIDKQDKI